MNPLNNGNGYRKASLIPVKPKPIQRLHPAKPHRPSIERFISNIDRDLLEFLLDQEEKYRLFVRALHDPAQHHLSFTALMKRYAITLHEIQALYTDGKRHMGLIRMANNLPQVLEDIGEDSLSHYECCSRCDGLGQISFNTGILDEDGKAEMTQRVCPVCKGQKEVRVQGSKDSRQQMLEAMRIIGKSAPQITLNQQFGSGNLEDELQVTQKIVMGDRS